MDNKNNQIDTKLYNFALIASTVYVFVLVILANRQLLCNNVSSAICPPSPFNVLHLIIHSAIFGYLLTRFKMISLNYRWKWYLLCLTAFSFLALVFYQRTAEPSNNVVIGACVLAILCFGAYVQEKRDDWQQTKYIRIACSAIVLLGFAMILKANSF